MRFLRAVPRRADAAGSDHAYRGGTDRAGSHPACEDHRLRPHLFDRKRPRPGSWAGREGWVEGHPGDLARQQPAEEPVPDFDRVRLAKEYPGVITSVVVGNEVLLRGEM